MANTNWQDPQTSEIRSTHISGLMDAVGKLEQSVGMETVAEENIPLTEVYISAEDRYRIFQAPAGKRNWLSSPAPVIKKNGVVITEGFVIDYGGGAIALSVNDTEGNTYTADVTYVTPLSTSFKSHMAEDAKYKEYKVKQTTLYGKFYQGLKNGVAQTINCLGDSITYGHDTVSADIRPKDATVLPDGSTHSFTRASKTYPEALSEFLNGVYSNAVTVVNRGFSGDTTEMSFNRWITTASSNLTLIMLGINDASLNVGIDNFILYYRKLIERELDWNSAVVILTPIKQMKADTVNIDAYSNALKALGGEYNIPVITTDEMLANYPMSIYSDGYHLNGTGYTILGAKIASLFVGEGCSNPMHVSDGAKLLTRPTIDNILYFGGATYANYANAGTPNEYLAGGGLCANLIGANAGVIYSFYTDVDDMIVAPIYFRTSNSPFRVELDFGVIQPDYSIDNAVYKADDLASKPDSVINQTSTTSEAVKFENINVNDKMHYIHIAKKGWHTLKITALGGTFVLYGLVFANFEQIQDRGKYIGYTHTSYTGGTIPVAETRIKYKDIKRKLKIPEVGADYYRNIALKITVVNFDTSVLQYVLKLGVDSMTTANGWKLSISPPLRFDLKTNIQTTEERLITNITYDYANDEIVITWGGNTSRETTYVIDVF